LGVVHQENGDERLAIGYFRIAQQVGPNTPDAWERLTFILARLGEKVEAVANGRRAVELGPKRSYAHAYLGFALMVSGDLAGALKSVETALELDDQNGLAHQWKADVLNQTRADPELALACAKRGLELMPTNPWMQVTLGHALHNLGRVDEAKAAHRDAAKREPATIQFLLKDYDK
jgi:Flp pilus assembly protein TadD